MARRGAPKDDPIMWEVGDESGNEPKGKKKDKSAGLMGKIKQPGSNGSGGLSKRAQKELERREYGNLDTESEEEEDFGAAGARAKKEKVRWRVRTRSGGGEGPSVICCAMHQKNAKIRRGRFSGGTRIRVFSPRTVWVQRPTSYYLLNPPLINLIFPHFPRFSPCVCDFLVFFSSFR